MTKAAIKWSLTVLNLKFVMKKTQAAALLIHRLNNNLIKSGGIGEGNTTFCIRNGATGENNSGKEGIAILSRIC